MGCRMALERPHGSRVAGQDLVGYQADQQHIKLQRGSGCKLKRRME